MKTLANGRKGKGISGKAIAVIISVILTLTGAAAWTGAHFGYLVNASYKFSLEEYLGRAGIVWSDEFDGTAVDPLKWRVEGKEEPMPIRGGYWTGDAVSVRDGCLVIDAYRAPDGSYRAGSVCGDARFPAKYGYFEARCRLPARHGVWAAFWLAPQYPERFLAGDRNAAEAGAEIDVMEAPYGRKIVHQAVHVGGYGKRLRSVRNPSWRLRTFPDLFDRFHTFGVYWNEDVYVFFVDREEVWKTSLGGNVSRAEEYIKLGVMIGGRSVRGVPKPGFPMGDPAYGKAGSARDDWSAEAPFLVDYVRLYRAPAP